MLLQYQVQYWIFVLNTENPAAMITYFDFDMECCIHYCAKIFYSDVGWLCWQHTPWSVNVQDLSTWIMEMII